MTERRDAVLVEGPLDGKRLQIDARFAEGAGSVCIEMIVDDDEGTFNPHTGLAPARRIALYERSASPDEQHPIIYRYLHDRPF